MKRDGGSGISSRSVAALCLSVLAACGPDGTTTRAGAGGSGAPTVHALKVTVVGDGFVGSNPAAIDCGTTCTATFAEGTRVTLATRSASESNLAGWSGACSGAGACVIVMNADATVTATFVAGAPPDPPPPGLPPPNPPPPPPPADECADLQPASLPPPVVARLSDHPIDGPCLSGSSDDGDGTFLLGFVNGRVTPPESEYDFFRTDGGSAARVGHTSVIGGDSAPVQVFSQPSGFSSFLVSGDTGGRTLSTWSHDGEFVSFAKITPDDFSSNKFAAVGIDPSGGTAVVKTIRTNDAGGIATYQRFDKAGVAETGEVAIDSGAAAVGVALSGHALIVGPSARWVARDGTPISDPFTLQETANRFQFLLDGSLALASAPRFSSPPGPFVARIEDGATASGPLPDWLAARASNRLYAVRSGKAYATWGSGGQCGGDLEILAPSGKSCGCVKVPTLSASTSVGRDGSLIVPRPNGPGCSYDLYPKLLR